VTGDWLLVAHIAVLGYWLGAELVINSEYRFICWRDDLPFAARDAMMDHLMDADQHVRYALILQLTLGMLLLVGRAGLPVWIAWIAPLAGAAWLALVEYVHRRRKSGAGQALATFDRTLRYAAMAGLIAYAVGGPLPFWLRFKLAAFAGIMACGVGIRITLVGHFHLWSEMAVQGATPERNAAIRATYRRATAILIILWLLIGAITLLSVFKPS
jgi:hypothetical protein